MEEDKEEKFERIPKDFLKGVKLIPRNFDMPEKPVHGEIVHQQLREDLFDTAYKKICDVEFSYLKNDEDYFKIKKIQRYPCGESGFLEKMFDQFFVVDEVDLIDLLFFEE